MTRNLSGSRRSNRRYAAEKVRDLESYRDVLEDRMVRLATDIPAILSAEWERPLVLHHQESMAGTLEVMLGTQEGGKRRYHIAVNYEQDFDYGTEEMWVALRQPESTDMIVDSLDVESLSSNDIRDALQSLVQEALRYQRQAQSRRTGAYSSREAREANLKQASLQGLVARDSRTDMEMLVDPFDGHIEVGMGGEWWSGDLQEGRVELTHSQEGASPSYGPVMAEIESEGGNAYSIHITSMGGGFPEYMPTTMTLRLTE